MKSPLLYLLVVSLLFAGCEKEANRKALNAYFNYEAGDKKTTIEDEILLQDNTFECNVIGDSVLYIHATKVYDGAGFIIRLKEGDSGKDGTYELNSTNKGFYENPLDKKIYYTNNTYKGSLTLKKWNFSGEICTTNPFRNF